MKYNELQQAYQNQPKFKEACLKTKKNYNKVLTQALSLDEKQLKIASSLLEKFIKFKGEDSSIFFYYGMLQPTHSSMNSQLIKYFFKNFREAQTDQYTFVFFNLNTENSNIFFNFKQIFMMLPIEFFLNLKEFIIVQPSFYMKALDYFSYGNLNKYFTRKQRSISNCTQLCEYLKINPMDFVSFVPSEISEQFPQNYNRRVSLTSYRINLSGQTLTQNEKKDKKQFQQNIFALITKEVYKLQNYELGSSGVPIILELLIIYFRNKPQGLKLQGLFRKSVSIDEENETLTELSKRNYQYLQHIDNPHLIANLMKRFFSNLKVPVIPFRSFEDLMNDKGVQDRKGHIKSVIKALPKLNYLTLIFLIDFLKRDVIPLEGFNKMSAHNIAICFSPSLMRSEKTTAADLIYASKSVSVTGLLISEFDYFFGNFEQRSRLFIKNEKEQKKKFEKTIDIVLDQFSDSDEERQSRKNSSEGIEINVKKSKLSTKLMVKQEKEQILNDHKMQQQQIKSQQRKSQQCQDRPELEKTQSYQINFQQQARISEQEPPFKQSTQNRQKESQPKRNRSSITEPKNFQVKKSYLKQENNMSLIQQKKPQVKKQENKSLILGPDQL